MSIEYNAPEANKGRWISIGQKVGATALAVITRLEAGTISGAFSHPKTSNYR
jgi:hypothetical protein